MGLHTEMSLSSFPSQTEHLSITAFLPTMHPKLRLQLYSLFLFLLFASVAWDPVPGSFELSLSWLPAPSPPHQDMNRTLLILTMEGTGWQQDRDTTFPERSKMGTELDIWKIEAQLCLLSYWYLNLWKCIISTDTAQSTTHLHCQRGLLETSIIYLSILSIYKFIMNLSINSPLLLLMHINCLLDLQRSSVKIN